ncbi:hypothetical protein NIES2104_16410 [Leptolyngbya sp. NIES-2104]|nr:hypothetical protein NIES2104_16410 [Leptolyngbya sp. NIES-2104]
MLSAIRLWIGRVADFFVMALGKNNGMSIVITDFKRRLKRFCLLPQPALK